jgi:hypothetical protein
MKKVCGGASDDGKVEPVEEAEDTVEKPINTYAPQAQQQPAGYPQ